MKKALLLLILISVFPILLRSQQFLKNASIHGNFELDAQYYITDEALGVQTMDTIFGMNAFGNINYTNGDFSAGLRYEAYLPPLLGFDKRYQGHGIPYWYIGYKWDKVEITIGHFYEQFGNGLILRSYEEWALGYDNNISGAKIIFKPFNGVYLKGLVGTQRFFWEPYKDDNRAVVRGFDGEFYLNEIFKGLSSSKTRIIIGGSFVSKYQQVEHEFCADTVLYKCKMPANVAAYAARINLNHGGFSLKGEYAYKINDPSELNNFIYKNGEALYLSSSYSQKGFGVILSAKRIDNMSFKSDIYEQTNALNINYLPPITKQYVYSLAAIYPYAIQPNGEMGIQGQVFYTIPKKSKIGGKYGTRIELNFSRINSIDKKQVSPDVTIGQEGTLGYESDFFKLGNIEYYQDINVKLSKKFNKKFKAIISYVNMKYNIDVIEGHAGEPMVKANIGIAELTYKITPKKSLRLEYQQLITKQDEGDWAMALLEFNIAPKWFFSIMDEYNYGNPDEDMQLHYYTGSIAYVMGPTRLALSYGRQREGLVCVGGVCRVVPATNGFTLNITGSF